MTILLTGGTGKTSSRIAPLLKQQGTPVLLASRSGSAPAGFTGCRFDWTDESTFKNPFKLASDITALYMVARVTMDILAAMKPFTEYAISKGVKRFVLLTSSTIECGGYAHGKVHEYLVESGVDYGVLRPTWFMENFSEGQYHPGIVQEGKIYSAASNGKFPIVSASDIAAVAVRLLTDPKSHNCEYMILGPELVSTDDVAEIFTSVLGKKIEHVKLSKEEKAKWLEGQGMPAGYAQMLAGLDADWLGKGMEEKLNDDVKTVTGKAPMGFRGWVEANKGVWL